MNERIGQLAEQAGLLGPSSRVGNSHQATEKFAELLVLECIGCCEQVISDPVPASVDTWLNGGSQCIDEIKQHFGVE
jgi:hypothetical protein